MNYLIIGASSISGQASLKAIKKFDLKAKIIATTSRDQQLDFADQTITNVKLEEASSSDLILAAIDDKIDYIIYSPARGEVGFPASLATKEMVDVSLDYSFRPFLKLNKELQPKRSICFSGFITMPPMLNVYGAMTFTKIAMENLVTSTPNNISIVRVGMFHSNSVRGIAILVQKNLMKKKYPALQPMYDEWKKTNLKFKDFFYGSNYKYEEELYTQHSAGKPFRPTEADDISNAIANILNGETAPIVNVLGSWYWLESDGPSLPKVIQDNIDLIPKNLKDLL